MSLPYAEMIVSKKMAFRCLTCIPEFICPTPHEEILLKCRKWFSETDLNEFQALITKSWSKIESAEAASNYSGIDEYLSKEAAEGKKSRVHSNKWCEDEKTKIIKLAGNHILIPSKTNKNQVILNVDHENYVKEKDVDIQYDDYNFEAKNDQEKSNDSKPQLKGIFCNLPYCTLGCVCESIDMDSKIISEAKNHCGKLQCMFNCWCYYSVDDCSKNVDIRSRLRPRVSMLNCSSGLNYFENVKTSPDKKKLVTKSNANGKSQVPGPIQRIKRKIVPPKRNIDFVPHLIKSLVTKQRQVSKSYVSTSAFKHIGNNTRLTLKQRQKHLFRRALKNSNVKEGTILRTRKWNKKKCLWFKSDNSSKSSLKLPEMSKSEDEVDASTTKIKLLARKFSKNLNKSEGIRRRVPNQSSLDSAKSRAHYNGGGISVEGTGPLIPPEVMAKFVPLFEIKYRPKLDKNVPHLSESEAEDSTDDENENM